MGTTGVVWAAVVIVALAVEVEDTLLILVLQDQFANLERDWVILVSPSLYQLQKSLTVHINTLKLSGSPLTTT